MENNNKMITVCFMLFGILMGIVTNVLLGTAAALVTGPVGQILAKDIIHHGLPVLFGTVLFFVLQFNLGVRTWADEVISEIRRVVWPSRKDTVAMTVVVCIMLVISGIVLGIFDFISGKVIQELLNANFAGLF